MRLLLAMRRSFVLPAAAAALLAACSTPAPQLQPLADPQAACSALAGCRIDASRIALRSGASIQSAVLAAPGALAAAERGQPPSNLMLAERNPKPPFDVKRSSPLCEWPTWPRRSGDAASAASFECTR